MNKKTIGFIGGGRVPPIILQGFEQKYMELNMANLRTVRRENGR